LRVLNSPGKQSFGFFNDVIGNTVSVTAVATLAVVVAAVGVTRF
jgi:hypothetical protein